MPSARSGRRVARRNVSPEEHLAVRIGHDAALQTELECERGTQDSRTYVVPKPFTSGTWGEYLEYFNTVSDLNKWQDDVKAKYLSISLSGVSASAYRSLSAEVRSNFRTLVNELTRLLDPPECVNIRKEAFKNRNQGLGEDLTSYFASLRCLAADAYPTLPAGYLDEFIKDQFVGGLNDPKVRFQAQIAGPSSSLEAFHHALRVESSLKIIRSSNSLAVADSQVD